MGVKHRALHEFLSQIFSDGVVLSNYYIRDLQNKQVQLDEWIPRHNLAFEFHGEQHYKNFFVKSLTQQKERDEYRREVCSKLGITLLEIPYWWDMKEGNTSEICNL